MKKILILGWAVVASCSNKADKERSAFEALPSEQRAIIAFMRENAHDSSSYVPGEFTQPIAFHRGDSANIAALELFKSPYRAQRNLADTLVTKFGKDSTKIGVTLAHTFRAKNLMGGLTKTTMMFMVYKDGQVQAREMPE